MFEGVKRHKAKGLQGPKRYVERRRGAWSRSGTVVSGGWKRPGKERFLMVSMAA